MLREQPVQSTRGRGWSWQAASADWGSASAIRTERIRRTVTSQHYTPAVSEKGEVRRAHIQGVRGGRGRGDRPEDLALTEVAKDALARARRARASRRRQAGVSRAQLGLNLAAKPDSFGLARRAPLLRLALARLGHGPAECVKSRQVPIEPLRELPGGGNGLRVRQGGERHLVGLPLLARGRRANAIRLSQPARVQVVVATP